MSVRTTTVRSVTATVLAALALVGATAAAAPASATGSIGPEPWQPETQTPFTVAAGVYCDDAFSYRPDRQDLSSRVLARYPDGAVRLVEHHGLLVGTFTNLRTGRTVTTDASGTAYEQLREDGSRATYTTVGPVGLGFKATDGFPRGYYALDGVHVIAFSPDGRRTVLVDAGTETNTCTALER